MTKPTFIDFSNTIKDIKRSISEEIEALMLTFPNKRCEFPETLDLGIDSVILRVYIDEHGRVLYVNEAENPNYSGVFTLVTLDIIDLNCLYCEIYKQVQCN